MAVIHLFIGVCIILLLLLIVWLSYKIYQNRKITQLEQAKTAPHCDENLLKFDQEIDRILNDPHLSDAEKEQLTNQCADKYLHEFQSHSA